MTADPGGFDLGLASRRRRIKLPPVNAGSPFTARGMTPLLRMDSNQLNWIANFIWGIDDDVLRDLYVRGKYRDVILPMTVLRRLDAVLEPTKQAVLDMKVSLDQAKITNQDAALRQAAVRRSTTPPVHPARSSVRATNSSSGLTSRLPGRLLAERAGHPGKF